MGPVVASSRWVTVRHAALKLVPLCLARLCLARLCLAALYLAAPCALCLQPGMAQAKPASAKKEVARAKAPAAPRRTQRSPTASPSRAARGPSQRTELPPELQRLGPLSIGHPHQGYLLNARKMPTSPRWVLTVPSHGYGTEETIQQLSHCLNQVHDIFPGSPKVMLGSISAEYGGLLPPHQSHRTGRDADVYFFRKPEAQWSRAATKDDIDLPRTWALLRCFVTEADVDMILIVRRVQDWLEEYALSIGEPAAWVHQLFHDEGRYKTAVVRDVPGHVAHMHVRFSSPAARRRAVSVYDRLVKLGAVVPPQQAVTHQVQAGDTLSQLAQRYSTTVAHIQALNGLQGALIKVGQRLVLSQAVDLRDARAPVVVPARRSPPAGVALPALARKLAEPVLDAAAAADASKRVVVARDETPRAPSRPANPSHRPSQPDAATPSRGKLKNPWAQGAATPRPELPRLSQRDAKRK